VDGAAVSSCRRLAGCSPSAACISSLTAIASIGYEVLVCFVLLESIMGITRSFRLQESTCLLLDRAHERFASSFPAIAFDGSLVVGKPLEVEDRLVSRCPKVAAHPIGDHVPPLGI
jgi:hypothetical protein